MDLCYVACPASQFVTWMLFHGKEEKACLGSISGQSLGTLKGKDEGTRTPCPVHLREDAESQTPS